MTQKLDSQIGDLYRLPLEEFTRARNTLAKQLSGSERKKMASLVKPSLPMWVINQLFWQDAPTYKALIDAAEKLRAAHRSALSGRKADDTAQPINCIARQSKKRLRKRLVSPKSAACDLTDQVREIGSPHARRSAGRRACRSAHARPPEPAGFSLLTGVKVRPQPAVSRAAESPERIQSSENGKSRAREEREAGRRAEGERKEAERKARQEQNAREKREREIKKAEQALRDAERRLAN